MKSKDDKFEKLASNLTALTKEEQRKIMGGMKWTGQGSKNMEMDRWTAMTIGDPWGGRFGIKLVD
ncbi:hypothetical protein [Pedobacter sp. ASV12]|uniref:hypothetical protein n=1 Tax=Pedobacter sp. ASV12 TaxID=2795120 RepID=UPI0018EC3D52|nr:hypothetical protein [Pedobacter sp. ASV12]